MSCVPWNRRLPAVLAALVACVALPAGAGAQLLSRYIPDYAPGLTDTPEDVQARVEPEFRSEGIRSGAFVIRPRLSESFGYDTNVDGLSGGRGSPTVDSQAEVAVASDWSRNSVSARLSVDDQRYTARGVQDFTNWTAALSGTYDIGRDQVFGGYTHLDVVQTPRDLGAVGTVPLPFQVDDINLGTTLATHGRFSFVPSVDVASYRFARTDAAAGLAQAGESRVVTQGQLVTQYELSPQRTLLLVLRGTQIGYTTHPAGGQPDSAGGAALVGFDYAASGLFRVRALVGYQQRSFAGTQYAAIRSPIVEASMTWTPRRLTTVGATVRREIDDSTESNTAAFTATSARLDLAQQVRRNVVLTGFAQFQQAEFAGTGSQGNAALDHPQTILSAGMGATWLLNRIARLNLSEQVLDRRAGAQLSYTENVVLLTLTLGL